VQILSRPWRQVNTSRVSISSKMQPLLPVRWDTAAADWCLSPSPGQHPADWCSPTQLQTTLLFSCLPPVFQHQHHHQLTPVLLVSLSRPPIRCFEASTVNIIIRKTTPLHAPFPPSIASTRVSRYVSSDIATSFLPLWHFCLPAVGMVRVRMVTALDFTWILPVDSLSHDYSWW